MISAVNRTQGRAANDGGMFAGRDDELLNLPEAQPIIKRIGENVDADYPGRMEHVRLIAATVIRAKQLPTSPYAKATL